VINHGHTEHFGKVSLTMRNIGIVFAILIPLLGLAGGWGVNSYRISELERKQERLQISIESKLGEIWKKLNTDHDTLTRIEFQLEILNRKAVQ